MRKGQKYIFNFINMAKSDSLYNHGMRPLIYSTKRNLYSNKGGWTRTGESICHYQNKYKTSQGGNFSTFSFEVTFDYSFDEVYFSHFYPYRYSDLQMMIRSLNPQAHEDRLKVQMVCKSIAGNKIDLLLITNFSST